MTRTPVVRRGGRSSAAYHLGVRVRPGTGGAGRRSAAAAAMNSAVSSAPAAATSEAGRTSTANDPVGSAADSHAYHP